MMLRNPGLTLLLSLTVSFSAYAAPQIKDFKVGDEKLKVTSLVPDGWDAFTNYSNTPLALLSPQGLQSLSTVVQIVPFGVKDSNDDLKEIQKDPDSYYSQKEEQAESLNGDILSYLPFEETKKDGATIYSIGVKYKNATGEFLDKTYYVSTKSKELFYIKTLIPLDLQNQHGEIVSQVVNTISSKN
jgi:hypothetical protein